jgi:hypothetical protein
VKGRVVSHASMNVKKKKARNGSQGNRAAQAMSSRAGSPGERRVLDSGMGRRSREEVVAEGARFADAAGERGAAKRPSLEVVNGEKTESRGTPPALPTPIATFTI